MTDIAPGLLPEGLRDRLPPEAEAAATLLRRVIDVTAAHGYERVQPPLAEFEANLVGRLKSARAQDLLRFVDPVSQRTLALRPDITAQVGRIASTRMAKRARPLRLAYGGQVLKVRGTQLRPEREMAQAGAELIGLDSVEAAIEIISVTIEALTAMGASDISIDLTLPDLVEALAQGPIKLAGEKIRDVQHSLDGKDAAALHALDADAYQPLIAAAGPLRSAVERLRALPGQAVLGPRLDGIERIAAGIGDRATITLDPTERHGFEYQSWIGFSLFVAGARGEVGRGGSYTVIDGDGREEPAVGFSLYLDPLIDIGLGREGRNRIFLPLGTAAETGQKLRAEGWATVAALTMNCDAQRLGCSHVWTGQEALKI